MAISEPEIWIAFASSALSGFTPDEEYKDEDDLLEHATEFAATAADMMLEEYKARFEKKAPRVRGGRRAKDEDEE